MARALDTTICRAFALSVALTLGSAQMLRAADIPPTAKLPIQVYWSADLPAGALGSPVVDGDRAYLALTTAQVVCLDLRDGHLLWQIAKETTVSMAAAGGLLFVSAGEAIEALHGVDGGNAWTAPRIKAVAPLVVSNGLLVVATQDEVVALGVADGAVAWRAPAGGVRLAPVVDGSRVFVGANDGRLVALDAATGTVAWEQYIRGGITALGASRGLVYAGGGEKQLACLDARNGKEKWSWRIGANPSGTIAVDDDRVYLTALDNVVRGLDRQTGNQRWLTPLDRRPLSVRLAGEIVFVEITGTDLVMLLARNGARSGVVALPAETSRGVPPIEVRETPAGVDVFVVTGSLANKWQLTRIGPAGEAPVEPFDRFTPLPGLPFLTDPRLAPIADVLPWLVLTDPPLRPFATMEWPVVLRDPPLEPLTTLPGVQLRPLSPLLPVRRGG